MRKETVEDAITWLTGTDEMASQAIFFTTI